MFPGLPLQAQVMGRTSSLRVLCTILLPFFHVQERITLKHSNMAKWARQQLAREHRDPAVRGLNLHPVPI